MKNQYLLKTFKDISEKYPDQKQFLTSVEEVLGSIEPVFERKPELEKSGFLEKLLEPEHIIEFEVEWLDDNGNKQVNKGYRVQFNSLNGPYKGGLRFNKNVNVGVFKALAFEQTFKNMLTGLPMGGGKGGSDFDPHGKSEAEIERFCHAFMEKLYPHIGATYDVPAGDLGVGGREIGYLLDEYLKHKSDIGAITGKPLDKGGLLGRSEATGYGLCYFVEELLNDHGDSFKGKRVLVSGSGNVATYANAKASEYGAKVIAMSDSKGYIYDENGIDYKTVLKVKGERQSIEKYLDYVPTAEYHLNPTDMFKIPCDICLPCATQNEINLETAKILVANGCILVGEGANMPSTLDAIAYYKENNIYFTPAKASNAGGVSCSYFEMLQNATDEKWTFEKTDARLKETMVNIYRNISKTAKEYGKENDYMLGANIWAFEELYREYLEKNNLPN